MGLEDLLVIDIESQAAPYAVGSQVVFLRAATNGVAESTSGKFGPLAVVELPYGRHSISFDSQGVTALLVIARSPYSSADPEPPCLGAPQSRLKRRCS